MDASVAIQILPLIANDEEKVLSVVDEVIALISNSGYNYVVGPFETTIEGDFEGLMKLVKECQEVAIKAGAPRIATYVKIFYQPDGDLLTIEKKTAKHLK